MSLGTIKINVGESEIANGGLWYDNCPVVWALCKTLGVKRASVTELHMSVTTEVETLTFTTPGDIKAWIVKYDIRGNTPATFDLDLDLLPEDAGRKIKSLYEKASGTEVA